MNLSQIKPNHKNKKPIRLGRGTSSKGKTCGRGQKGQKSRRGFNLPKRFEGGQTSLIQRMPKVRGFKSYKKEVVDVNYNRLVNVFKTGSIISPKSLFNAGIIESSKVIVKILGPVKENKDYIFNKCRLSASVAKLIKKNKTKEV